ncbi:TadE/TadG family type IV pilus assembly protein [Leekyejoonella antrihumi]|nr:TadE/TadG family type IV pilus assembly protein [Leekyejoonella antrihumi]
MTSSRFGKIGSRRNQRGSASIELVGLLPVVVVVVLLVLQFIAAAYVSNVTTTAARAAARAYSLGENPTAAVDRSLPFGLRAKVVTLYGPDHGATVEVTVPRLGPLPAPTVSESAVMP